MATSGQIPSRIIGQTTCIHHKGRQLDLFCMDCQELACMKCLYTTHRKHLVRDLSEIIQSKKDVIVNFIDKTENVDLVEIDQYIASTDNQIKDNASIFKELSNQLKAQTKILKEDIDLLTGETLSLYQQMEDDNSKLLQTYKQDLEMYSTQPKQHVQQCKRTLQDGTDIQIYDEGCEIKTSVTPPIQPPLSTASFSPNQNPKGFLEVALGDVHVLGQNTRKSLLGYDMSVQASSEQGSFTTKQNKESTATTSSTPDGSEQQYASTTMEQGTEPGTKSGNKRSEQKTTVASTRKTLDQKEATSSTEQKTKIVTEKGSKSKGSSSSTQKRSAQKGKTSATKQTSEPKGPIPATQKRSEQKGTTASPQKRLGQKGLSSTQQGTEPKATTPSSQQRLDQNEKTPSTKIKSISKGRTTSLQDIPKGRTTSLQEISKGRTTASQKSSKGRTTASQEISKGRTSALQETTSKGRTTSLQEISKGRTTASQKSSKGRTTASQEISKERKEVFSQVHTMFSQTKVLEKRKDKCSMSYICPTTDGQVWTSHFNSDTLNLLDRDGKVIREVNHNTFIIDISLSTTTKTLWICDSQNNICEVVSGQLVHRFSIMETPLCICVTVSNHVIVGMAKHISKFTTRGELILTGSTAVTGKQLVCTPYRISECPVTYNVAVADRSIKSDGGEGKPRVVVMDTDFKELFVYDGEDHCN